MTTLIVWLMLAVGAAAQEPPPVVHGTWTATAAPREVLRGKWSAQALPGSPNAAQGSWVLLNDGNRIVLEGTWSAQKSAAGWRGAWSARVATGRSAPGRGSSDQRLSGTWQAQAQDAKTRTMADMLQRTLETQISGAWRSGARTGNWWLDGSKD